MSSVTYRWGLFSAKIFPKIRRTWYRTGAPGEKKANNHTSRLVGFSDHPFESYRMMTVSRSDVAVPSPLMHEPNVNSFRLSFGISCGVFWVTCEV